MNCGQLKLALMLDAIVEMAVLRCRWTDVVLSVISMIFPPPALTKLATVFNSCLSVIFDKDVFAKTLGSFLVGSVMVISSGF